MAVAEAAASLCVLSSDPGKGGTQVTVIFPCRCSVPVALHLLSAALPGTGRELSMSALPLLCWLVLNQKPASQYVCKRCPYIHFLTPKWALRLLCCPCPSLQVCAELHCVHKDKHTSLAKKIIKILLKTYTRKNVYLKAASLHVTIGFTFSFSAQEWTNHPARIYKECLLRKSSFKEESELRDAKLLVVTWSRLELQTDRPFVFSNFTPGSSFSYSWFPVLPCPALPKSSVGVCVHLCQRKKKRRMKNTLFLMRKYPSHKV